MNLLEPNKDINFAPMLNGTATNRLAVIGRSAKPTRFNPLSNDEATIENGDLKVFIEKYAKMKNFQKKSYWILIKIILIP